MRKTLAVAAALCLLPVVPTLAEDDAGIVRLGGEDLTRLPMHLRARRGLGYLPQEASIFRKLTVRQNLTAVLEALGVGRREREERARRGGGGVR